MEGSFAAFGKGLAKCELQMCLTDWFVQLFESMFWYFNSDSIEKCFKINDNNYPRYILGLAELYQRTDNIKLSEYYINQGINYCKKNSSTNYLPYYISNRGKNFLKNKRFVKAILDLKSSLNYMAINDDYANYSENCFYIAESYNYLKQKNLAVLNYKKVDSLFNLKRFA